MSKDEVSVQRISQKVHQSIQLFDYFQLSWFSANYFCRSKGWHLISTKDLEESVQLYGFLQFNSKNTVIIISKPTKYRYLFNLVELTVGRYWTSGNRLADRRSWYWNLHNEAMGYTNWAPNYPETEKAQYCMQLSGILWYSYDCERLSKYICKKN